MRSSHLVIAQSLIEVVVAVGVISLVLVGVSDLISRSLALSTFQANKNSATNIAQNQLSYYRQQRDLSPAKFFLDPQSEHSACIGSYEARYSCRILYSTIDNGVEMKVVIEWKEASKPMIVELSQILAKNLK